jgi:hypothetical protein
MEIVDSKSGPSISRNRLFRFGVPSILCVSRD